MKLGLVISISLKWPGFLSMAGEANVLQSYNTRLIFIYPTPSSIDNSFRASVQREIFNHSSIKLYECIN